MHLIITDAWLAKSRAVHLTGTRLLMAMLAMSLLLIVMTIGIYHWVVLKGIREGWPVLGSAMQLVVKDDVAQRERYLRENIDAMARRVGEMQARMMQVEALSERISGLAGIKPADFKTAPGQGGVLISGPSLTMDELNETLRLLEQNSTQRIDLMTMLESRLFDEKIRKSMVPTHEPVEDVATGSPFGWRIDPFTGRSAMHTGLDFPAPVGTPILAAAGGVVVTQEFHPGYGSMVEIDHGNDLISRYAHTSKVYVKKGDLVKRGQHIADVGTTGRSTGPHLHFEVLVQGVQQDPQKFLDAGANLPAEGVMVAKNKPVRR